MRYTRSKEMLYPYVEKVSDFFWVSFHWILQNPIVVLTGLLVVATYIYTRYVARTFRVLADEYLARIQPHLSAKLILDSGMQPCLPPAAAFTVFNAPAILDSGYIWIICSHGTMAAFTPIQKHKGRLLPGETLEIRMAAQRRSPRMAHVLNCGFSLAGYIHYTDVRRLASHSITITRDGRIQVGNPFLLGGESWRNRASFWFEFKWMELKFWWKYRLDGLKSWWKQTRPKA